jgi:hypothetical protein
MYQCAVGQDYARERLLRTPASEEPHYCISAFNKINMTRAPFHAKSWNSVVTSSKIRMFSEEILQNLAAVWNISRLAFRM